MSNSTYSTAVSSDLYNNILKGDFSSFSEGLRSIETKTEYETIRLKSHNLTVVVYNSKKIVLQGREHAIKEFREKFLNQSVDLLKQFLGSIGSDEAGKGDYFGPLVVGAAYLDEKALELIEKFDIMDSKAMKDGFILEVLPELMEEIQYSVTALIPKKYNSVYSKVENVNILLSDLHAENAVKLVDSVIANSENTISEVVIDQFSKSKKRLIDAFNKTDLDYPISQFHKGEQHPAVALGSVFARGFFLHGMQKLSSKYGFEFPKGATHVIKAGKNFVKRYSADELQNVAKITFKTTDKVLS